MDALYGTVCVRIEGSRLEERSDNKLWLVRDLEIARQFILDDLRVVKQCCVPCFPPEYEIFTEYVKMYHNALSKHVNNENAVIYVGTFLVLLIIIYAKILVISSQLEEIIQSGLEGNEYVSLLSWVMNEYPGAKLMGHPDLQVDLSGMEPLINSELLKELENEYLKVNSAKFRQKKNANMNLK